MSNNKKAQYIREQAGKRPCEIQPIVKTCAVYANALENSKLGYEYVRIDYSPKYSKYADGLLIDRHVSFYIHRDHNVYTCLFPFQRNALPHGRYGGHMINYDIITFVHLDQLSAPDFA